MFYTNNNVFFLHFFLYNVFFGAINREQGAREGRFLEIGCEWVLKASHKVMGQESQ